MKPPITSAKRAFSRRSVLQTAVATGAALAAPAIVRAQAPLKKIRIGYWPIAAGLPFYAAVELGYFKEAGLDVEVQRYAGAQQIMEGMLAERCDGSANGTGSANLAVGEIASPGSFKIFCSNPSNVKNVLDEVLVPVASTAKSIADLKGKRVASGPGIQNVTLAKAVFERGGATGVTVVELPLGQHVAAMAAGQIDGSYALGAHRHHRPLEQHHPNARSRRDFALCAGRSDGAMVRRLGFAHRCLHQGEPGRSAALYRRVRQGRRLRSQ